MFNDKMKENAEIRFKTTTETKDKIKVKADKLGMTIKSYLIFLGLNVEPKIVLEE